MKTKIHQRLFLCLLIVTTVNFFSYSQDFIVNDDFETDALGTLPDGWLIRFNGTGDANQKIVETPVKNGIHSFQVSGSSWAANLSKSVVDMPNDVTLEGWARAENVTTGGRSGIAIGNPSIGSWGAFLARVEFYNGNIIAYYYTGNSGGYGTQYVLQTASPNTWYHFKILTNTEAGTYKVFINDVQASSNTTGTTITEFPLLTTVSPTSVELYGNSMIYFDDIKLYETKDLVAYYPFNGNANDESGNNHNGTVFEASLTADKDGNINSAYYFDGIDDYIDLGDWENGGEMSFTFWARWDATNNWSRIIEIGNGQRNDDIMISNYFTYSEIVFYINKGTTENYYLFNANAIEIGAWDFYSATVDNVGLMKIYKNGVLISENLGHTPNKLIRTEQFLGKSLYPGDDYFNGAIDEMRIYGAALSASEVLNLYNNNTLDIAETPINKDYNFKIFKNSIHINENQELSNIKSIYAYNLLAQVVFETNDIKHEMPLEFLGKGIYILKVAYTNGSYSTLKFYIQ